MFEIFNIFLLYYFQITSSKQFQCSPRIHFRIVNKGIENKIADLLLQYTVNRVIESGD